MRPLQSGKLRRSKQVKVTVPAAVTFLALIGGLERFAEDATFMREIDFHLAKRLEAVTKKLMGVPTGKF